MGSTTAARCISLFPLLIPRSPSLRLLRHFTHRSPLFLSPPPPLSLFLSPPKLSHQLHTQPLNWDDNNNEPHFSSFPEASNSNPKRASHPWPEWLGFTHWLSLSGFSNGSIHVDEFVDDLELPLDFLRAAHGCLAFARQYPNLLWCLSREDVEVVITSGSPFLFKDASGASTRLKSFLGSATNDVSESDRPSTVDLMKFLVSYARMAIVSSEKMSVYSRVESSTRKLFSELAKSGGISVESVPPVEKRSPEGNGQAPSSFGKNIVMKRCDWICSRCSFMNFAKNSKCLQCEEPRPKRYLTGGEWDCPECNFCNFSRNVVCLRCDCKKPVTNSIRSPNSVSGLTDDTYSVRSNKEENLPVTEEKQQSWFTKLAQLEKSSDTGSAIADKDFPEIKQAGKDRFAQSTRNNDRNSDHGDLQTPGVDSNIHVKISRYLDEAIGERSSTPLTTNASDNSGGVDPSVLSNEKPPDQIGDGESEQAEKSDEDFPEIMPMRKGENRFVVSKKKDRSLTSPMYKRRMAMEQAGNNNYVPFVPFPPGYFAQDKPKEGSDHSINTTSSNNNDMSSTADRQSGAISSNSGGSGETKEVGALNPVYDTSHNVDQTSKSSDSQFRNSSLDGYPKTESPGSSENQNVKDVWKGRSLEGSAVKEPDPLDMSEEAKAERWFRRVAQIKDISELSQIPDEDFPSIMPMRKGVNRFVVSKRKTPLERRLTSSQYRRNLPVVNSDPVKKENDSS